MKIRILITGGTFDKEYNELTGSLYFRKTHLNEMLELGRCRVKVETEILMLIDSLDMEINHRLMIAERCLNAEEDNILITHGTDSMVETAQVIGEKVQNKTIVLTGAMIPYKFGSSDGLFNLGSAMAFVQTLPHGVYIAMNGRYFNFDNCRKKKEIGEFREIS